MQKFDLQGYIIYTFVSISSNYNFRMVENQKIGHYHDKDSFSI